MMSTMKHLKLVFGAIAVLAPLILYAPAGALAPAVPLHLLAATPKQEICTGIGLATADGGCGDNGLQANNVLAAIINLLSVVIGIVAVVMIIVAGFRFITSGGDAAKVSGAKNAIIYALIGLVIVVLAQFIVRFVLTAVS